MKQNACLWFCVKLKKNGNIDRLHSPKSKALAIGAELEAYGKQCGEECAFLNKEKRTWLLWTIPA